MTTATLSILTAFTSTSGALAGVLISTLFTRRSSEKQARMQTALKLAEFRQAWIDSLREAMAEFQSYGVTPGVEHFKEPKFYQVGTKIELMMNRSDPEYSELDGCLYDFLMAETETQKYTANPKYVLICQNILKREWDRLRADLEATARSR